MMPRWWKRWRWRRSPAFRAEVARECALLRRECGKEAATVARRRLTSRSLRQSHRWVLHEALLHLEAEDLFGGSVAPRLESMLVVTPVIASHGGDTTPRHAIPHRYD